MCGIAITSVTATRVAASEMFTDVGEKKVERCDFHLSVA